MTDPDPETLRVVAPTALEIELDGSAGSRRVDLVADGELRDEERDLHSGSASSRLVVPDEDAWAKFRRGLEGLAADRWEADYQPQVPVYDGESWGIVVVYADGFTVRSEGYAVFPPGGPLEESNDQFDAFCGIVSDLVGEPFGSREEIP